MGRSVRRLKRCSAKERVFPQRICATNPFPRNLGEVLAGFETVIIPEMNLASSQSMIRARYLVDAVPYSKVKGRPFQIREIVGKVEEYL